MDSRIYQDATGGWIVFDGETKTTFGADEKAAQQAYRRLQIMSAIKDFESGMTAMGLLAEQLIPGVDKAIDIYTVNQLAADVTATAAGEFVGDSTLTKEAMTVYVELMNAFDAFLTKSLPSGLTPKQIVRLR
jgi:hypothetical protein